MGREFRFFRRAKATPNAARASPNMPKVQGSDAAEIKVITTSDRILKVSLLLLAP